MGENILENNQIIFDGGEKQIRKTRGLHTVIVIAQEASMML